MGVHVCNTCRTGADVYDWRNTVMIYSKGTPGNGVWHCPFSPKWVERMRQAAKHCEKLSADYIDRIINSDGYVYHIEPGEYLEHPQDCRGLPVGYCENISRLPVSCDIYNYESIPDVVVTDGYNDWPLCLRGSVLMA